MQFFGSATIVQLPPLTRTDPIRGTQIGLRFRGRKADCDAYQAGYILDGLITDNQPDPDGAYGILTVWLGAETTQPAGTPLVNKWDLLGQDVDISAYNAPKVREAFPSATAEQKANLRADLEAIFRGETTAAEFLAQFTGTQLAAVTGLLSDISTGQDTFPSTQYVLRWTRILASNSTVKPTLTNVGRVWTTAELQSAEPIPATLKFGLPDGYWRKRTPTTEQTSSVQWTTTIEWEWSDQFRGLDQSPA